jgi:hypothetical protein
LLIDKKDANIEITKIEYGTDDLKFDVKETFQNSYLNNDVFSIPQGIPLHFLSLDPRERRERTQLFISYKIGIYPIDCTFSLENGILSTPVRLNMNWRNALFYDSPQLYFGGSSQPSRFADILSHLDFQNKFKERNSDAMSQINHRFSLGFKIENTKVNIIHLRLEDDAVSTFASSNKKDKREYKQLIEDKYIEIISKSIRPSDLTLVISGDYNNRVIDFLSLNQFQYFTTEKFYPFREMNAIHDLLFYNFCNNS